MDSMATCSTPAPCLYSYGPRDRTRKKNRGKGAKVPGTEQTGAVRCPGWAIRRLPATRQLYDVELEDFGPVSSCSLNRHRCLEDSSESPCLQRLSESFVGTWEMSKVLLRKINLSVAVDCIPGDLEAVLFGGFGGLESYVEIPSNRDTWCHLWCWGMPECPCTASAPSAWDSKPWKSIPMPRRRAAAQLRPT